MSLDLVDRGSLARPGPIGRLLRLTLGIACLYGLWELVKIAPIFVERPLELLPNLSLMIFVVLYAFNYVVNIGFSRNWKFYPTLVSILVIGGVAGTNYLVTATANSLFLGALIVAWMGYFYSHLGLSFVLSALIATPGCEMRALPELFGKITNRETKEHYCPSSIISGIDRWENNWRE